MSNQFSIFLKKKVVGTEKNLISLDEPYAQMQKIARSHDVKVIIDAGASNARISKRLLDFFPGSHVHAFEPNTKLYKEPLDALALQEPRFHPYYIALSDHAGKADLHITESPGATSLLKESECMKEHGFSGTAVERIEQVELTTIDQWARQNAPDGVHLMKFDIQGAEIQALKGAAEVLHDSTLLVYIEVWFNPVYQGSTLLSEVDILMRKHGFLFYDLFKPRYSSKGLLLWANVIYAHGARLGLV